MRSQLPIAVLSLILLAAFIAGGVESRRFVSDAFETSTQLAAIRALSAQTLNLQLDEETGIRGYAATDRRDFLEPYFQARARFDDTASRLKRALESSRIALVSVSLDDARAANRTWLAQVAEPILQAPRNRNLEGIEAHGKTLVDRFREDMGGIDAAARARASTVADETRAAIDRINLLVGAAVAILLLVMVTYGVLQLRATAQLEAQERAAEAERREKAQLLAAYQVEKRIADTLQEAFTQRPLPEIETLQFSASYVPATEDTKFGGDWYDAMALGEQRVLFAIGDVTGHGIEAAVTMNSARQSLLASALRDADPAAVLGRVNADLFSRETRLVTAVVGIADSAKYEFCYAIAGHPPPILLEPGRPPRMLECGSLPLGAVAGTRYTEYRIQSVPGALLVLYTDGAVEHSRNVLEGERVLLAAVAEARARAERDAASVIHEAIFAGRSVGDDVAILTIGFASDPAAGLVVSADRAQSAFTSRIERSERAVSAAGGAIRNLRLAS